jgi:ADP-ribose pyrophosphatase
MAHFGFESSEFRLYYLFVREAFMKTWNTLSRRILLQHSKYLTVESHTVELPDGRIITDWPWLVMPDYVNVVAVTGDGKLLCFRQTKYCVQGTSLAPVGGYLEPGEEPQAAAQRELREETGYTAPDWTSLGHFHVDANRGAGQGHFFLARGAAWAGPVASDDLEEQELLLLSRAEVESALFNQEFKTMPWAFAISLALLQLA